MPTFYAHSSDVEPTTKWQTLEDHLRSVAQLASDFAQAFQSGPWGYCAGLWHDLGKYQPEFQQRLLGAHISVEYSGIDAALPCTSDSQ